MRVVGAGSGLASLRPHILSVRGNRKVWLIYGERHPVRNGAMCQQLHAWKKEGLVHDLDISFSQRDQETGRYVRVVLCAKSTDVRAWLQTVGTVIVYNGLEMGRAIKATLRALTRVPWLEAARSDGRYRHELY